MPILKIAGYGASAALASPISIGSTQAAMAPAVNAGNANVHYVDCAVGFPPVLLEFAFSTATMISSSPPLRAIVVDLPPAVVEHNDEGCEKRSGRRLDLRLVERPCPKCADNARHVDET